MKNLLAILVLVSATFLFAAQDHSITFSQSGPHTYDLTLETTHYNIIEKNVDGNIWSVIEFGSATTTMKKGYAALPVTATAVRLPNDKNVDLQILDSEITEIALAHPLLPSKGVLYRWQNPADIPYQIDPQSITDSWYPADVAEQSLPFIIRDARGCRVQFSPFQYNAKRQVLRVYNELNIRLSETDTAPVNPLRHTSTPNLLETRNLYQNLFINSNTIDASSNLSMAELGHILVLTTSRDESAIQPYIDWKREKGFTVTKQVVSSGTLVKDIIQQNYDNDPALLYVQIVGDWDDIQSELGTSSNLPMDPAMGCVSGTDDFPDIAIGRISGASAADVSLQVNKILTYEKNPPVGTDWLSTATGIASEEGAGNGDDGEIDYEHEDVIWNDKLDPFTYDAYNAIYEPTASKSDVNNAVNTGTGIINYTGHGSQTSWGTTGFNNSDVNALTNGDMQPIILSVACNNGEFNMSSGDCFAEAWLKKDNGGAVFMLASTISQPWQPPMRGQDYFNDILIGGYDYDAHSGQSGINTNEQRTLGGSIVVNGFNLMLTESNTSSDLETIQTWTIFGDPSMQFRTKAPETLTVSNDVVRTGEPFTTNISVGGQPLEAAMVTLSQNGSYYSGLTDANGDVTIEHSLAEGTATLVVTAFNTETVYREVTVSPADGPWVKIDSYSIDDASGNGNGNAENDETFFLDMVAINSGNQDCAAVSSVLQSSDTYLTLLDTSYYLGDMPINTPVTADDAFRISVVDGVPDQHAAACQVEFSDTSGNSWTSNLSIIINAPQLGNLSAVVNDSAQGNSDGDLDIGEMATLTLPTYNSGHNGVSATEAVLTSSSSYITILSPAQNPGVLNPGDTIAVNFDIQTANDTPPGTSVDLYYFVDAATYSIHDTFTVLIGDLPVVLMHSGSEEVSDVLFYDTGGAEGAYGSRERLTLTFHPQQQGAALKAVFQSFELSDNDNLAVYDGTSTGAAQVSGSPFTGSSGPDEIVASNPDGALTFEFTSNLAGTAAGWKAEIMTTSVSGVRDKQLNRALQFSLADNYPNPFNPKTSIRYEIGGKGPQNVELTVFDIRGKRIRTLVNAQQAPGNYRVYFEGGSLASGVYFYTLRSGRHVETKKMVLMR